MSDPATDAPVRDTEVPQSPDIAVSPLLGAADVDRLAAMTHALLEEVADIALRLDRIEARLDGRPEDAPEDLAAVQARVAALVARVTG